MRTLFVTDAQTCKVWRCDIGPVGLWGENSTLFFLPSYLYLFRYNHELARLYFYILLSGLSLYEVIDKKLYMFDQLDLNQYKKIVSSTCSQDHSCKKLIS